MERWGAVIVEGQEYADIQWSPDLVRHLQDNMTKAAWAVMSCGMMGYAEGLSEIPPPWEREDEDE